MRASVGCDEEPTVDVKFCLVFPREALSVPVMRHMLGDSLRALGAEDQGVADLLLAVTEACTNVVRHGGPSRFTASKPVSLCERLPSIAFARPSTGDMKPKGKHRLAGA